MATLLHPTRDQMRLEDVLSALGNPVRLSMVRQLACANPGPDRPCGSLELDVTKATATHHWRVLREGGVVKQWQEGRSHFASLRRDDLNARFPGLLDVVLNVCGGPLPPSNAGHGRPGQHG